MMVKIKIDGREIDATPGAKLIDVARNAGFIIPSLCYDNRFPHYTSCMVCMVKDKSNGRFFASCSATVAEGMDIDVSGSDVTDLRRKSTELLLLEHRAECEAPCRLVCPMDLDVPLMNRLIGGGKIDEASELTFRAMGFPATLSYVCPAYCDNSCRRKKVDKNVSICRLKRHVAISTGKPSPSLLTAKAAGKSVAIAGAGASGLSAAYRMAQAGHKVTIFEKSAHAGGVLLESISSGTLPSETFQNELENLTEMGVNVVYNQLVDSAFITEDISVKFKVLINATGMPIEPDGAISVEKSMAWPGDTKKINDLLIVDTGGAVKENLIPVRCFQYGKATGEAINDYLATGNYGNGASSMFNSTLGKVADEEWAEWVKESRTGAINYYEPATDNEAIEEAARCMHCDCRASSDCRLRETATSLEAKNPREKFTSIPITKKINPDSGLIFEHAKCIKCGLCVRLGATLAGEPTLCFSGRGFGTMISEPLYHKFEDILTNHAGEFADICPTGALEIQDFLQTR